MSDDFKLVLHDGDNLNLPLLEIRQQGRDIWVTFSNPAHISSEEAVEEGHRAAQRKAGSSLKALSHRQSTTNPYTATLDVIVDTIPQLEKQTGKAYYSKPEIEHMYRIQYSSRHQKENDPGENEREFRNILQQIRMLDTPITGRHALEGEEERNSVIVCCLLFRMWQHELIDKQQLDTGLKNLGAVSEEQIADVIEMMHSCFSETLNIAALQAATTTGSARER